MKYAIHEAINPNIVNAEFDAWYAGKLTEIAMVIAQCGTDKEQADSMSAIFITGTGDKIRKIIVDALEQHDTNRLTPFCVLLDLMTHNLTTLYRDRSRVLTMILVAFSEECGVIMGDPMVNRRASIVPTTKQLLKDTLYLVIEWAKEPSKSPLVTFDLYFPNRVASSLMSAIQGKFAKVFTESEHIEIGNKFATEYPSPWSPLRGTNDKHSEFRVYTKTKGEHPSLYVTTSLPLTNPTALPLSTNLLFPFPNSFMYTLSQERHELFDESTEWIGDMVNLMSEPSKALSSSFGNADSRMVDIVFTLTDTTTTRLVFNIPFMATLSKVNRDILQQAVFLRMVFLSAEKTASLTQETSHQWVEKFCNILFKMYSKAIVKLVLSTDNAPIEDVARIMSRAMYGLNMPNMMTGTMFFAGMYHAMSELSDMFIASRVRKDAMYDLFKRFVGHVMPSSNTTHVENMLKNAVGFISRYRHVDERVLSDIVNNFEHLVVGIAPVPDEFDHVTNPMAGLAKAITYTYGDEQPKSSPVDGVEVVRDTLQKKAYDMVVGNADFFSKSASPMSESVLSDEETALGMVDRRHDLLKNLTEIRRKYIQDVATAVADHVGQPNDVMRGIADEIANLLYGEDDAKLLKMTQLLTEIRDTKHPHVSDCVNFGISFVRD